MSDTNQNNLKLATFEDKFMNDNGEECGLPMNLLRGIYSIGFNQPTEVQQKGIIPLAIGRDVIIQGQSGTGKTGAFTIGSLYRVEWDKPGVQVCFLAPTTSLIKQIAETVKSVGKYCLKSDDIENPEWLLISYGGGTSVDREIERLRGGKVKVIACTTGRAAHLMRVGGFGPDLKTAVFDEADSLLDERFMQEIREIISRLPKTVQIAMFSATMSDASLSMARKLVRSSPPFVEVLLDSDKVCLSGICQYKVELTGENVDTVKVSVLEDLYRQLSVARCIIFVNSRKRAEWLGQYLRRKDHHVSILHGDLTKDERIFVENQFRKGETRVMISSDLLSRGFDVQDLSLVINFDVPVGQMAVETYIHRVGRTGRYGRKGCAISLVKRDSFYETNLIEEVVKVYGGVIDDLPSNVDEVIARVMGQ